MPPKDPQKKNLLESIYDKLYSSKEWNKINENGINSQSLINALSQIHSKFELDVR